MGNQQTNADKRIYQFDKDMTSLRTGTKEEGSKTGGYYELGKKGYDSAISRWENWSKKYPHEDWYTVHPDKYDIFVCENINDKDICNNSSCMWEPKMKEFIAETQIENPDWISQQNHHGSDDIKRLKTNGGLCKNQTEPLTIDKPTKTKITTTKTNKKGSRLVQMRIDGIKLKSGMEMNKDLYVGYGNDSQVYVFFLSEMNNGMFVGKNITGIHKLNN
jgi:hypothetical protein